MKILMIRLGGVGDTILTSPLYFALKKARPQSQLHLVIRDSHLPLVEGLAPVDRLIPYSYSWRSLYTLLQVLKVRYDFVLDFYANPRSCILTALCRGKTKIGLKTRHRNIFFDITIPALQEYKVLHLFRYLLPLGISPENLLDIRLRLPFQEHVAQAVRTLLKNSAGPYVAIGFMGIWKKKWGFQSLVKVGTQLFEEKKLRPVLLWGPEEKDWVLAQQKDLPSFWVIPPLLDLGSLSHLLRQCQLYVGNDCGASHMAVAWDIPSVTVFSITDPAVWLPNSPKHSALGLGTDFPLSTPKAQVLINPQTVYERAVNLWETFSGISAHAKI